MPVEILKCGNNQEVLDKLRVALDSQPDLFPSNIEARIVVKPNLNSNLDALTGNTTDLRVLSAVLTILQERGFRRIMILEGPNGGFHRDGINVFARNSVEKLGIYYECEVRDVNYESDFFSIEFENAGPVQIANLYKTCDLFINLPKLKTHYETLTSVSLKSLIGTLVGQPNKAKAHGSLIENILRINDAVVPHLHIVDGLIAMEGTGPSAGTPVRTDLVLVGTNAYEIEIVAARLMGFSPKDLPLIRRAISSGRISEGMCEEAGQGVQPVLGRSFEKPNPNLLARLVVAPGVGHMVRIVRNSRVVSALLKRELVRRFLLSVGLTQEVIMRREKEVTLSWSRDACISCGKCKSYCPQLRDLPAALDTSPDRCIGCLYCFAVCPTLAIQVQGELGYYREQVRRYGERIKEIA